MDFLSIIGGFGWVSVIQELLKEFDENDLYGFCYEHNIRETIPDSSPSFDPNYTSPSGLMSKDSGTQASLILLNLPREKLAELLDRIREDIRINGKDNDRIKNIIKDFLKSLGYRF